MSGERLDKIRQRISAMRKTLASNSPTDPAHEKIRSACHASIAIDTAEELRRSRPKRSPYRK